MSAPAGVSRDWLRSSAAALSQGQVGKQKKATEKRRGERSGYLSNDIIATELVLVHDSDNYGGLPQHVGRHVKGEGLVKDGVQAAFHYHRLLLFHTLVLVHQPHFNVRICRDINAPHCPKTALTSPSSLSVTVWSERHQALLAGQAKILNLDKVCFIAADL